METTKNEEFGESFQESTKNHIFVLEDIHHQKSTRTALPKYISFDIIYIKENPQKTRRYWQQETRLIFYTIYKNGIEPEFPQKIE